MIIIWKIKLYTKSIYYNYVLTFNTLELETNDYLYNTISNQIILPNESRSSSKELVINLLNNFTPVLEFSNVLLPPENFRSTPQIIAIIFQLRQPINII